MRSKAFVMAEEFRPSVRDLYDSTPKGAYSHDFLSDFKIFLFMKSSLYGIRPVKLKTRVLFQEIDTLLDQRFQRELLIAKKSFKKKKKKDKMFSFFVYKSFLERYNNNLVLAEKKLLTFLFSIHSSAEEIEYVDLFQHLLNDEFHSVEMNCFLLLR